MKFRWQNALFLMVLCAVVGGAVAFTYTVAEPRIEKGARQAADSARQSLFPAADSFVSVAAPAGSEAEDCCAAYAEGRFLGCTARIAVSGCQGPVEITAGMDTSGKITGIIVGGSAFAETPGMGAKVREDAFTSQFANLTLPADLNDNIDGVTGATISSKAVVNGVNRLGEALTELIARER